MLKVVPVYGFGWFNNGKLISTPAPFEIFSVQPNPLNKKASLITGKIRAPSHPYNDLWAVFSLRSSDADSSHYNITISNKEPVIKDGQVSVDPETIAATGFASLD